MAKQLGRDHRVIGREITRNSGRSEPYRARVAKRISEERSKKTNHRKLEKYKFKDLQDFVLEKLREDWSPEQISGRLKDHPELLEKKWKHLRGQYVCTETIYQYIYEGEGRYGDTYTHLRRKKKPKRQRRFSRKPQKTSIPERISIHTRPEEINEKSTIGHWETDTVEGKRGQKQAISVQHERKLLLTRIHKIEDKTAQETETAIRKSMDTLPEHIFKSITYDNGSEGANHIKLKRDYGIQTYFCDAYASWQKGGVENTNGLLRQYIPKGSSLSNITHEKLYWIQEKLNNRPRKTLNYLTPNEMLFKETGVGH